MSYWFGFLLNELPFVAFYWLLVSTLIAVGQGDIDSPVGWLAFCVAVVTTAGLVVVAVRGLRARPVLDRALSEGLGTAWQVAIDDRCRSPASLGTHSLRAVLMRRGDVERVANISYGDAGKLNQLDVYCRRAGRRAGRPSSTCMVVRFAAVGRTARRVLSSIDWRARAGCASARTTGSVRPPSSRIT